MSISIRQIEAFLCLANARSFTRAAEQLHITQPGLSLMIQELEQQLRSRLFERSTRDVQLTGAGQRFLIPAQRIVDEMSSVRSQVQELSVADRPTLWVGTTPLFASSVMPRVYQQFRKLHPHIQVYLVDVPRDEVAQRVRSGEIDCGVGIFWRRVPELQRQPLFKFDFILIEPATRKRPARTRLSGTAAARTASARTASARHERAELDNVRWNDLPSGPYVELPPTSDLQQLVNRRKAAAGLQRDPRSLSLNYLESIIGMTAAGAGPAIMPSFVLDACKRFNVKASLISDPVLSMDFHLVVKRSRSQPKALGLFVDVMKTMMIDPGLGLHPVAD